MKDTRSNQELNKVIAALDSWREYDNLPPLCRWKNELTGIWNLSYPDYCSDLNAINAVENKLDLQTKGRYADYLRIAVYYENQLPWVDAGSFAHINASARARAEALVIVIESQKV